MQPIKITRPLATHLLALAQKSPEQEICGLVSQINHKPNTVYPITNIAEEPATAFEMDPELQISAFKTMREQNEELFAIYHSHPSSPPTPSIRDIENLGYPDAYYLIISLSIKGVLEMRAFKLSNKEVVQVDLLI